MLREYIDAGKVKIFSINSINRESWLNRNISPRDKVVRQQQYNGYISEEVVPYIWTSCQGRLASLWPAPAWGRITAPTSYSAAPTFSMACWP